jgi:hypothetical protein
MANMSWLFSDSQFNADVNTADESLATLIKNGKQNIENQFL